MNGATNEKRHFSASPLEQRALEYLWEHWELWADGGFSGKPRCATPYNIQQAVQQPERAHLNREQRSERVVAEYAIGGGESFLDDDTAAVPRLQVERAFCLSLGVAADRCFGLNTVAAGSRRGWEW